jgi:hypothetical protein
MTVLLALGAGALALWVDVRFPKLEPRGPDFGFLARILAVPIALTLLAPMGLHLLVDADTLALKLAGLFAVAFPCLVYAFLVAVWILKLVQRTAANSIR